MKEFDVTITETLKLTVSVEASSKEEAQQSWASLSPRRMSCGQNPRGLRSSTPS